jgi:hypothetical protein
MPAEGIDPHDLAITGFCVQRVCQFRHAGAKKSSYKMEAEAQA